MDLTGRLLCILLRGAHIKCRPAVGIVTKEKLLAGGCLDHLCLKDEVEERPASYLWFNMFGCDFVVDPVFTSPLEGAF